MNFSLLKKYEYLWYYLAPALIFSFFLFHIGDQSAPRQGTEGFYLEISKEMFSKNSFIIPYYLNQPHFSKPPLQFWLTTPFYFIFGQGLFSARLSIFVITCGLIACTSKLLSRLGSLPALSIFILFLSTFGVIKYSRIYMMEAFLTFFTGAGTLFAYDFLKSRNVSSLLFSSLLLAASALVKGPISIVMALTAIFAFILSRRDQELYRPFALLCTLIMIPASLWYIACFSQFGSQFIDYFFIRENLGKLTAQTYSPFVLVQGLLFFSFPVIVPFVLVLFRDIKSRAIFKNDLNLFLTICLVVFWTIWIIPTQRSHHYAMPATFFVISYVAISKFDTAWFAKLINWFSLGLSIVGVFAIAFIFFFKQFLPMVSTTACFIALLILAINIILSIFIKGAMTLRLAQYTTIFLLIWYHIASMVALPVLPDRVREQLVNTDSTVRIGVVYRKPYFVSELLGREIEPLSQVQADSELQNTQYDFLIMPRTDASDGSNFQLQDSWNVWKRGLRVKEIYDKLTNSKINELQETYGLFHRKL